MLHHVIGFGHLLQCRARMTRLSTGLSLRGPAQRARLFNKTITRGGLATVTTISGEAVFQGFDAALELRDLLLLLCDKQGQRLDQGNHGFWPLFVDSLDFLMGHHSMSLSQIFTPVGLFAHGQRG